MCSSSYFNLRHFRLHFALATAHSFFTSTLTTFSKTPVLGDTMLGSGGPSSVKCFNKVFFPDHRGPLALLQWGQGGPCSPPPLLSYFSIVSMSWFTFAIFGILCCGPLTCFLLATPLSRTNNHSMSNGVVDSSFISYQLLHNN